MHIRDIVELHLTEEKAEEFSEWAWGEGFKEMELGVDCVPIWNERHGDILTIYLNGDPRVDIPLMIAIWENEM